MARRSTDELAGQERMIDVRGPRFSAALTVTVLGIALVFQIWWLVAFQAAVFAIGALAGLRWSPYGNIFRLLKRAFDLGPPPEVEPEGPPRFSQLVGFAFTGVATAAFVLDAATVGWVLTGVVVAVAALLAVTGICIGCEMYLLGQRLRARS